MEKIIMSSGIVTAIVLCLVGILKLPFKTFKKKHCNGYKALFTILSFIFAIGLSVINEMYVIGGQIVSIDFLILVSLVIAGVFFGYGGIYEGLGIKELTKKIIENIKKSKEISKNEKYIKYVEKLDNAVSIFNNRHEI